MLHAVLYELTFPCPSFFAWTTQGSQHNEHNFTFNFKLECHGFNICVELLNMYLSGLNKSDDDEFVKFSFWNGVEITNLQYIVF